MTSVRPHPNVEGRFMVVTGTSLAMLIRATHEGQEQRLARPAGLDQHAALEQCVNPRSRRSLREAKTFARGEQNKLTNTGEEQ
jgi:hypothetical protein